MLLYLYKKVIIFFHEFFNYMVIYLLYVFLSPQSVGNGAHILSRAAPILKEDLWVRNFTLEISLIP